MLGNDGRFRPTARAAIAVPGAEVWASIVSLWEITLKVRVGKLRANPAAVARAMTATALRLLELQVSHLSELSSLPTLANHRDPFDHLLIAQARSEGMTFVSDDTWVARYPVAVMDCSGSRSVFEPER